MGLMTSTLIKALDYAHTPRQVRAVAWMLEKSTGFSTTDVSEWYARNGYYRIGGGQSYSSYTGKTINFDSALGIPAFYAGVKLISEDLGTLPFFLYRRKGDLIERATDHPLYSTLHDMANPEFAAGEFVEALTCHALVTGCAYARIKRYDGGVWLWPWQPEDVREMRDRSGVLYYDHRENSQWRSYGAAQVFHLRGFIVDTSTRRGDSLLKRAAGTLGISAATEEYAGRYFANDATPGIVLVRDISAGMAVPPVGPESVQAIKDAWKLWHQGLSKSHEPAVIQDGFKVQQLTPTAEQAQMRGAREFQVLEACRLLRLPPYKLCDYGRMIQSNIEQSSIEYTQMTLSPWTRRWRQAVYRCLLTPEERAGGQYYAEHSMEAFQRGDFAAQTEGWRKMLEKGVFSINEVRRFLNLNPVEDGDKHFIQLNLSTVQAIAQELNLSKQDGNGAGGQEEEAFR